MAHEGYWGKDSWDAEPVGPKDGKNYSPANTNNTKIVPVNMGAREIPSQVSGAYEYSKWQGQSYKKCPGHDGLTIAYAYPNGASLAGASRYELMRCGVDLLIDCGVDVSNTSFVRSCPAGFEDLKVYGMVPNMLRLDWADRTAPAVGWEFWRALREKFQPNWNIVACCLGGHGRTGTCLAALLIEDGMTAEDAIEHVRTVHCSHAVESLSQEAYLKWLAESMPPREEVKG